MSSAYGLKAIIPTDAPHILGIASARTGSTDLLLNIWNGSTSAARIFAIQKDGYVWLPDGGAAAPALAFYADPDTGLFSKAANSLGFAVGGAELGYLDASGLSWGGGSQIASSSNVVVSGHTHVEADITDLGTYLTTSVAAATYAPLASPTFTGAVTIGGDLNHDGSKVGFYGAAPYSKPTVSGSRANTDTGPLAQLLTALDNQGLITNSSLS